MKKFKLVQSLFVALVFLCLPLSIFSAETGKKSEVTKVKSTVAYPVTANPNAMKPAKATRKGVTKSAKPDLVVSIINHSPGAPRAGDEITIYVFVKNIGQARSDAFGAEVKVGGASPAPVIQIPGLNPNQQYKHIEKITFDTNYVHSTNLIVKVTADVGNDVVESVEGNNIKQKSILIKPTLKPDLKVTKINYSPGAPKQHEQVKVWYFVKNLGPGKSPKFKCKLRTTNSLNSQPIWNEKTIPALKPGKEWRKDGFFISNMAGTYTIRAVVACGNQVVEMNEQNNELTRQIVVSPN
ncbi:MAG: hypothetical protein OQL19_02385 [Gammaproteobacteria bacterium]|nr:hypothetical protein [Gammaproteobacteria bacterium]